MKQIVLAAVMAAGIMPVCCFAQSAFDGTWKIDANQIHLSDKPEVLVVKDGPGVTGTSIMGLMMLGAAMGDTITISADGDGAEGAVGALCELVEAKFGED